MTIQESVELRDDLLWEEANKDVDDHEELARELLDDCCDELLMKFMEDFDVSKECWKAFSYEDYEKLFDTLLMEVGADKIIKWMEG